MELRCLRKGSVSYGLGADFSLPYCLVGDRVSESNLEPSPAGISDLRAEISWCIVMVRRSGKASRRYRCQLYFFSRFQLFCSLFFLLNTPCGRHSVAAFKKQDNHIDIKADKSPDDINVFITDSSCCSFN